MTAAMYLNIPPHNYAFDANVVECSTPDVINAMINNNYVHYPQSNAEMDHYLQYPVALSSGPDQNMIDYCDPALASSPPLPTYATSQQTPVSPSEHTEIQCVFRQIVKDTLKETIQKRSRGRPSLSLMDPVLPAKEEASWQATSCYANSFSMSDDSSFCGSTLTPEDEERRRRRRERNKIAATKCRNKKKEKTQILVRESEDLEHTNVNLKKEIKFLNEELQRLTRTLECHACVKTPPINNSNNFFNGNNNYVHTHADFNIEEYPSCAQL